jgi:hypothetical protein
VGQGVGPEFKPQYCKKRKEKKKISYRLECNSEVSTALAYHAKALVQSCTSRKYNHACKKRRKKLWSWTA